MNEQNEKRKFILTVDGPDCTGKTTIWTKLLNKEYSANIRGIVSNVAYGLKYGRNIKDMIDEYNKQPLDYLVLIPRLGIVKRVEFICSRLSDIANSDKCNTVEDVRKELTDLANTMDDMEYFTQAIKILNELYKGKILTLYIDTDIDHITGLIDDVLKETNAEILNPKDITNITSDYIHIINCLNTEFEEKAKSMSEYKKIILFNKMDKFRYLQNLLCNLDSDHDAMASYLIELHDSYYILDEMERNDYSLSAQGLIDFLEEYEVEIEVSCEATVSTTCTLYKNLADLITDFGDAETYVNDSKDVHEELVNNLADELPSIDIDYVDVREVA